MISTKENDLVLMSTFKKCNDLMKKESSFSTNGFSNFNSALREIRSNNFKFYNPKNNLK